MVISREMKNVSGGVRRIALLLFSVLALNAVAGVAMQAPVSDLGQARSSSHVDTMPAFSLCDSSLTSFAEVVSVAGGPSGPGCVRNISSGGGCHGGGTAAVTPGICGDCRKAPVVLSLFAEAELLASYGMSQSGYYIYALRRIRI